MALCADRGFGADVFDGVWMWEDAVTAYLKEEKNLGTRSVGLRAGSLVQPRNRSWLFPRFVHDTMSRTTPDEALLFDEWVERIQREGMNVLLIVTADDQGYVVIDDEHEDLKYRACVLAGVTSLTCDVRSASNPGAMEDALVDTIDFISVASADLCGRLETEAFGRQIAPPVERPATRPDGSATPAPVATPLTRRERVDDFLARCNREYTGSKKLNRTNIWTLVHQRPTQFLRWQREDQEATDTDRKNFERILAMTPHDFIETVTKRRNRTR